MTVVKLRLLPGLLLFLIGTITPGRVAAQDPSHLAGAAVRDVVEEIAMLIESNYVFPEIGRQYAEVLRERAAAYGALSANELASRVTGDLQSVNRDLHLRVSLTPAAAENTSGGMRVQRIVPGTGQAASAPERGQAGAAAPSEAAPTPAATAAPAAGTAAQLYSPIDVSNLPAVAQRLFVEEGRRNHFFSKVEILPGNIGYLDYDQFGFPNFSTGAADAAFAFLAESQAIIIDLRGNRGGIEGMNQYLASHFFGDEPVHLYSRYYGSYGTTVEYSTFPDAVARRFPERPLYVLVDRGTGSAAENFTFAMQGLGRATVVGDRTAGAAHSSRPFPIAHGLTVQLPIARAYNPRTDEDWEGRGVQPDLAVDPTSALEVAHRHAVDRLIAVAADPAARSELEDAKMIFAESGNRSVEIVPADYVGDYGRRRVFLEGGELKMARNDVSGVPAFDLVALARDYFTLAQVATARVRFEREGATVVRMYVRMPDGSWEEGDRR